MCLPELCSVLLRGALCGGRINASALSAFEDPGQRRGLSAGDPVLRPVHPREESSGNGRAQHGPQVPGEAAEQVPVFYILTVFSQPLTLRVDCLPCLQTVLSIISRVGLQHDLSDQCDLLER